MHFVYILKCKNGQYYTGITRDIKSRIAKHRKGEVKFTKPFLPVKCIFISCFPSKNKAAEFEKYLKTHSGSAFRNKRLI
ncbi:GIY-YIG nuclease family protein [Patescibacteria group bacterium]|nr:GIY-YIG nuclease family protein [Patescibacteria group bacterium]